MDGDLHRYFLNNAHKPMRKFVHYFDIYERHLSRFRNKDAVMIEIGVADGGSLAMWRSYLGSKSKIIGLDINPECKKHEGEGIDIFIGSQDDDNIIGEILARYKIDIVLDDGSHFSNHMKSTFEMLYNRISPTGLYMVEDTHACYWPEWGGGGGVKRDGSFMEFVKDKIDEINAFHTLGALPVSDFTRSTDMIACYDSIVAFEKKPQADRQAPTLGPMS